MLGAVESFDNRADDPECVIVTPFTRDGRLASVEVGHYPSLFLGSVRDHGLCSLPGFCFGRGWASKFSRPEILEVAHGIEEWGSIDLFCGTNVDSRIDLGEGSSGKLGELLGCRYWAAIQFWEVG